MDEETVNHKLVDIGIQNPGEKYDLILPLEVDQKIVSLSRSRQDELVHYSFHLKLQFVGNTVYSNSLKVEFLCYVPNSKSCEYFILLTSECRTIKYILKGETKAPSLTCPRNKVFFHCVGQARTIKKTVELKNESETPGDFHFDIGSKESPIVVLPISGRILPEDKLTLTIAFTPRVMGYIYEKLYCLIKFQPPLQIEIYGAWTKSELKIELAQYIKFDEPLLNHKNMYDTYLQDCTPPDGQQTKPIVTTDRKYIDFGRVDIQHNVPVRRECFQLTNHSATELTIIWSAKNAFRILPAVSVVPSRSTGTFSATFQPTAADSLEAEDMGATLAWGPDNEFIAPLQLTINCIGNSFENDSCGWDAHCCLKPPEVRMPSTVPCVPSYSTMTMKREGHLPVMFKFIPPAATNYIIKPMQGLIRNKYQIAVVKLIPGVEAGTSYVENWNLMLNNSRVITFKLSGFAELPSLKIGNKLWTTMPVLCPNSEKPFNVPLKNPTSHPIRYSIIKKEGTHIEADQWVGHLWPGEEIEHKLIFCPTYEGSYTETLRFIASCSAGGGLEHETEIVALFRGESTGAVFDVNPPRLDFGDVLSDDWAYGTIVMHNLSASETYVSLEHAAEEMCPSQAFDVSFKPQVFTLKPNGTIEVEIGACPHYLGQHRVLVSYRLRRSEEADEVIDGGNKLLEVTLYCTFPRIAILDIRNISNWHNAMFSKFYYWRTMQIDELNEAFKMLKSGAELTWYCRIIDAPLGSPPMVLQFLLQNKTFTPARYSMKYLKSCLCEPVKKQVGISFSKWDPACCHDEEITFYPPTVTLQPREKSIIEMKISHSTSDCPLFKFVITVRAENKPNLKGNVRLFLKRKGFEHIGSCAIGNPGNATIWNIFFFPVRIANIIPFTQVSWVYNNLATKIDYELKPLDEGPFYCHNPAGSLEPFSVTPLMISFAPIILQQYKVDATLRLGDNFLKILMSGFGMPDEKISTLCMTDLMPRSSQFRNSTSLAQLSTDHLSIGPMVAHSVTKRLIFLKNNTEDALFYEWSRINMGGLIKIKISPSKGYLSRGEILAVVVKIRSLGKCVQFTYPFQCDVLNFSQYEKWKQTIKLHHKVAKIFDCCFTITEKGVSFPECKVPQCEVAQMQQLVVSSDIYVHSDCCIDYLYPKMDEQLSLLSGHTLLDRSSCPNEGYSHEPLYVTDILKKSIWNLVTSQWFKSWMMHDLPRTRYNNIIFENSVKAPNRYKEDMLDDIILSLILELFSIG